MAKQRRFEFRDGKSAKFWAIELSGNRHTVTYGRIGTDGQSKTKHFADKASANTSCKKLIEQKSGKGYVETSATETTQSNSTKVVKKSTGKRNGVKKKPTKKRASKSTKVSKTKKKTASPISDHRGQFLIEVKAELAMLNHRDEPTKKPEELKLLHGFMEQDSLCEYVDEELQDLGLTGGYLRVEFDNKSKKLFIITDYNSPNELSKRQLRLLEEYTRGQWSDGVGEGCFDTFSEKSGYGVETYVAKANTTQSPGKATTPANHGFEPKKFLKTWKQAMDKNQPKGSKKEFKDLMLAIANEKVRKLDALLGKVNLNQWQKFKGPDGYAIDGETPLTCACEKGRSDFVKKLLDFGADPQKSREDGNGPIHCCTEETCLKLLLAAGVSANAKSEKYDRGYPLHQDNILKSPKAVRCLIASGADPNAKEYFEKTPLENAASHHLAQTVKILLAAGANPTEEALDSAASGIPYMYDDDAEAERQIQRTTRLILDAGAKVTPKVVFSAIGFCTPARLKLLLSTGFNVNHPPYSYYTNHKKKRLLELAAEQGSEDGLVDILLKNGADPNKCPEALDVAIESDDEKLIRQLLKAGAKPTKRQLAAAQALEPKICKMIEKATS